MASGVKSLSVRQLAAAIQLTADSACDKNSKRQFLTDEVNFPRHKTFQYCFLSTQFPKS